MASAVLKTQINAKGLSGPSQT